MRLRDILSSINHQTQTVMTGIRYHWTLQNQLGRAAFTGRNAKNPQTEILRKHVTTLRKLNGLHVFPVADSCRLFMFPWLRIRRNRTTFCSCFRHVSVIGNKCFRSRKSEFTSRKHMKTLRKYVFSMFPLTYS